MARRGRFRLHRAVLGVVSLEMAHPLEYMTPNANCHDKSTVHSQHKDDSQGEDPTHVQHSAECNAEKFNLCAT